MHISDFDFSLPDHLIARYPPSKRGDSRLLAALPDKPLTDTSFSALPDYINAGDVLVFNNTKVIKARLFGTKNSGGKIEVLIERVFDTNSALAHIRASKPPKKGTQLIFSNGICATMEERMGELFRLHFTGAQSVYHILEQIGHLPLPPYIGRDADNTDDERYQTVYAKHCGAVAAPTAGLHFTDDMLKALHRKGVQTVEVTLHIGAGTFQPVRAEDITQHKMHREWFNVPPQAVAAIEAARQNNKHIWAIGTTSMRALESAAACGTLQAGEGDTDIFITPGYRFRVVDRLITNFHLPKSTLLMLVAAFSGIKHIHNIYRYAVAAQYRFFSYGDAMLLGANKDERL